MAELAVNSAHEAALVELTSESQRVRARLGVARALLGPKPTAAAMGFAAKPAVDAARPRVRGAFTQTGLGGTTVLVQTVDDDGDEHTVTGFKPRAPKKRGGSSGV